MAFLLCNAPALGAGDREFESLYPDTRETTVLCQEAPSNGGAFSLSYLFINIQLYQNKGHVFEGHNHPFGVIAPH